MVHKILARKSSNMALDSPRNSLRHSSHLGAEIDGGGIICPPPVGVILRPPSSARVNPRPAGPLDFPPPAGGGGGI